MEMKLSISLICLTLVTFLVQESNGIQCYQCGSVFELDTTCEDPFKADGVQIVDCPDGSCTKTKLDLSGQQIISRNCGPRRGSDTCDGDSEGSAEGHVCSCNSDKCNTATSATVTMATLIFTTVGTVLYSLI